MPKRSRKNKRKLRTGGRPVKKYHYGGPGPNPPAVDPNAPFANNTDFAYHEHHCSDWNGENFYVLPGTDEIDPYGWFPPDGNQNRTKCEMAGKPYNMWTNTNPSWVVGCATEELGSQTAGCCSYNDQTKTCVPNAGIGLTPGDTTGDTLVNVQDMIQIVDHILGYNPLNDYQWQAADLTGNGFVDVQDAVALMDMILVGTLSSSQRQQLEQAMIPLGINIPSGRGGGTGRGGKNGTGGRNGGRNRRTTSRRTLPRRNGTSGMTRVNGYKKGGKAKKLQSGGLLRGPSHAQGGIPAVVAGNTPVELEGGEYIINAQTVNAVGTQYLDKLNRTANTYHQGGFQKGQIGNGSKFKKGGKVKRRKKLQQGGGVNNPIVRVNLQAQPGQFVYQSNGQPYVGPYHQHQDGTYMIGGGAMGATHNIIPSEIIVMNGNGYKKGGKITNRRNKMKRGGRTKRKVQNRRIPKKQTGGMMNQCPPGQYMSGGVCVGSPSSGGGMGGGYRRGGKITKKIKSNMRTGGKVNNRRRRPTPKKKSGGYVYHGTNTAYNGPVIQQGGNFYSTKSGTKEGNSRLLQYKKGGKVGRR